MTAVESQEAGPALAAGPAHGPLAASPDAGPALAAGPAGDAPRGFPSPQRFPALKARIPRLRDRRTSPADGRGRPGRVVVAAAVAGAMLAGGVAWLVESAGPATGTPTVVITARHSRFGPDRIRVKPGSTVRFVIHNTDPIDHEFIIGPPEVHDRHERGSDRIHGGVPGEITVPAGATVETTFTFGPSGSPPVEYGCHLGGHWAYGMHGKALIR